MLVLQTGLGIGSFNCSLKKSDRERIALNFFKSNISDSLVIRANRSQKTSHSYVLDRFSPFLCPKANRCSRSLLSCSFLKSVGSDSLLDIKRGKQWKTYNKKSLVFWERLALITSESLTSFFFKEWRERFTHGRSFVKSNERDSLFFKEQQEWIAHGCSLKWSIFSKRAKSEWVKEWIPNPAQQWSFSHN